MVPKIKKTKGVPAVIWTPALSSSSSWIVPRAAACARVSSKEKSASSQRKKENENFIWKVLHGLDFPLFFMISDGISLGGKGLPVWVH